MIRLQRIKTSDTELYSFMECLMISSFPEDEYRDLNDLKEYTDSLPCFYNNIIFDSETPIGLITYWQFDSFYYAEHLAIDPSLRNGGYGRKLLELLKSELKLPIVLEVELPEEEMAQRRINFYKREGFALWEKTYFQPPYKDIYKPLPMYLMVSGSLDAEKDFDRIKENIYEKVYYGYKA